jgi:hypothetical protein
MMVPLSQGAFCQKERTRKTRARTVNTHRFPIGMIQIRERKPLARRTHVRVRFLVVACGLVPKTVKNSAYSSFVYWLLI